MDVNNTRFFLLRDRQEFAHRSTSFSWDSKRNALALAPNQALRLPRASTPESEAAWQSATPLLVDQFGQIGRISTDGTRIEHNAGRGFFSLQDAELRDVQPPAGRFSDLAIGGDGRLVAAWSDGSTSGILVFHLGRRWSSTLTLDEPVVRVLVDSDNRAWCATGTELLLCEGEPLPLPYTADTERFEPKPVNPTPLRRRWSIPLPAGFRPLAMCATASSIVLLMRDAANVQQLFVRPRNASSRAAFRRISLDANLPFVVDIGVVGEGRVAALCLRESADSDFRNRDCPVLDLDRAEESGTAAVIGERYPMLSQAVPRFASSLDGVLRYQADAEEAFPGFSPRPRALHALNKPHYRSDAIVTLRRELDSGVPQMTWHRVFMEGSIPAGLPGDALRKGLRRSGGSFVNAVCRAATVAVEFPTFGDTLRGGTG